MIPKELDAVLAKNPNIMSGAACFAGARVPVQALLDTLDDGDPLETFLAGFPDVTPQQVHTVLRWEQAQARHVFEVQG